MARMLSVIAWQGGCLLALIGPSLPTDVALAETEIRVSTSTSVVENPFATGAPATPPVDDEPDGRRTGPTTYQNPFVTMSPAPPIEIPMRPGPISRWRRRLESFDEPSPIKTAILSADPFELPSGPWNELPSTEELQERAARSRTATGLSAAHIGSPPDPIDFTAQPLHQPNWLSPSQGTVRPLPPIELSEPEAPAAQDPFELPGDPLAGPTLVSPKSLAQTGLQWESDTPDSEAVFISDYAEPSDQWLVKAQQAAQTAAAVDELSQVASLCQRGLAEAPEADMASALRRLAAWAHNRRGELLVEAGRQPEATRDFQIAISLDPQCSLAIHNRAVTLAQQNETAAALRDFNRVIELNPGLALAYRNRAELLAGLGRVDEAVRDFDEAIEGLPDNAELYRARAAAWQRLGDHHRALADLEQAIQLDPNHPDAFTQRGNIAAEQGDFDAALNDFRRALELDIDWADAHRSLAWLQATCPDSHVRDPQKAIESAEQAQRLSPANDCFMLEALAAAHASAGEFDEAVDFQRQAIAASPPDFADPLRQRLALYQQNQPFVNEPPSVRAASHDVEKTNRE